MRAQRGGVRTAAGGRDVPLKTASPISPISRGRDQDMTWAAHQQAYWEAHAPYVICNDSVLDWCRCERPRDHDGPCCAVGATCR